MEELKLLLPTFNGNFFPDEVETGQIEEYGDPRLPVTVYKQAGVRVVLGTHDPESDPNAADLLIERQPNHWAIFIHPEGGDPSCYIYIHDDGQTFILPDDSPAYVQIVKDINEIPDHHSPRARGRKWEGKSGEEEPEEGRRKNLGP